MEPPVPIGLVVRNGFYLAGWLRAVVIPAFRTYVNTVVPETLAAFGDIERWAEEVTEQTYQQSGTQAAGEDYGGDMGAEAEKAFDAGLAFYELMSDFRQAISNLLAVGMYHLLEQQLADLTEDGLFRGLPSLQDGKLSIIKSWFQKNLGIDLTVYAHWQTIEEELRRVANTVKHADGSSAVALREKRPDFFKNPALNGMIDDLPFAGDEASSPIRGPLFGDGFYLPADALYAYGSNVIDFLEAFASDLEDLARPGPEGTLGT